MGVDCFCSVQAIRQQKLPKELLETSLRPIFPNLGDIRNLTIPFIQGLGHILDLLPIRLKVTLGEKFLEHLRMWLEPEKLTQRQKPGKLVHNQSLLQVNKCIKKIC